MAQSPAGLRKNDDMLLRSTIFVELTQAGLSNAFAGLSLNPLQELKFLPESARLATQLNGQPMLNDLNLIDQIITERLGMTGTDILGYASDCFFTIKAEKGKAWCNQPAIQELLAKLSQELINYTALSLMEPDMFTMDIYEQHDMSNVGLTRFMKYLEKSGVQIEFLESIFTYLQSENPDFAKNLNQSAIQSMAQGILNKSSFSDGTDHLQGFNNYLRIPGTMDLFTDNPMWIADTNNGRSFQEQSPLGAWFSPGIFPKIESLLKQPGMPPMGNDPVREKLEKHAQGIRTEAQFKKTLENLNTAHMIYVNTLIDLVKKFLRHDKEKMLAWIGASINSNKGRVKLNRRTDFRALLTGSSSDSFCMNVLDVLLYFCKPFFNLDDPKVAQIDLSYLIQNTRVDLSEETPINKDIDKSSVSPGKLGPISEYYCLCMLMVHYGWTECKEIYIELNRKMQQLQQQYKISKNQQIDEELKYLLSVRLGYDAVLQDSNRNASFIKLGLLNMHLMLKLANFDGATLPLPTPISPIFAGIPEFWLQDSADLIEFIAKVNKEVINLIDVAGANLLINFTTAFLLSKEYFSSPQPRIAIVHMLSEIIEQKTLSSLGFQFQSNEVARTYLIDGLIQFYVDIEFTDSHNQFYEKFQYRHYATVVLKFLWKQEHYQKKTLELQDTHHFVKFCNMLVNDTSFFIDEGISQMFKIKELQDKIRSGQQLTEEESKDQSQMENYTKYLLQNAGEALSMLTVITPWTSEIFMREEFRDRMAAMLNYFLVKLYGPGNIGTQIDNPGSLGFKPMDMVSDLLQVYVVFSKFPDFIIATIKDERSYNSDLLLKVAKDCHRQGKLPMQELKAFEDFIVAAKTAADEAIMQEEDLGEVPDEFLCPITAEIMRNPVRLPTSGQICERGVISRILLSDQTDPFNRAPLTIEEVEELPELKAKIEEFIRSKTGPKQEPVEPSSLA